MLESATSTEKIPGVESSSRYTLHAIRAVLLGYLVLAAHWPYAIAGITIELWFQKTATNRRAPRDPLSVKKNTQKGMAQATCRYFLVDFQKRLFVFQNCSNLHLQ